jgi:hypothetical protein
MLCFVSNFAWSSQKVTVEQVMERFMKAKNFDKLAELKDFHASIEQWAEQRPTKTNYYFLKEYFHRLNIIGPVPFHAVYDGEKSWVKPSMMPTIPGNSEIEGQFDLMYEMFFTPVYGKLGTSKFELSELNTFGGETFYHITMIDSEGIFTELYIDTVNYDLRKVVKLIRYQEHDVPFEMYLDDYKVVNDIRIPFEVATARINEPLTFKVVEIKFDLGMTRFDFRRPQ